MKKIISIDSSITTIVSLLVLLVIMLVTPLSVFSQVPTISSFTPMSGPIGTEVTIVGANFDTTPSNNIVFFGATKAVVSVAKATELTVSVPAGATYQPITVLVNELVTYSPTPFTVTFDGTGVDSNSFDSKVTYSTGLEPRLIKIGDLDGDGKSDLLLVNNQSNTLSVFRNNSTSISNVSFESKADYATGTEPISVAIGDLDGDGKPDIAVANYISNTVSVFLNTSTGVGSVNLASKVDFETGSGPSSIIIGDLDLDGRADLALVNFESNSISLLRNISTGIGSVDFALKIDYPTSSGPIVLAIGDLDSDGKADLVVANIQSDVISVFRNSSPNTGIISYDDKVDISSGDGPWGISIGDLDGDNLPDLAVANYFEHTVSVFRNTSTTPGTINFDEKSNFSTGVGPRGLVIGDIDGDGRTDLATANEIGGSVSLLGNISTGPGDINFAAKIDFAAGSSTQSIAFCDLDGDGKEDFAVVNRLSNTVAIFRNIITPPSDQTDIISFSFIEQTEDVFVDTENYSIDAEVAFGTDVTSLIPSFTLSSRSIASVLSVPQDSGTSINDFTNPLEYTVTAEDGITTQVWTVTVTTAPSTQTDITSFSFVEQTGEATIGTGTIDIEVVYSTDITSLNPSIALFANASIDPANGVAQDFTNPVIYIVTAEDGTTTQDWEVNVTMAPNPETTITAFSLAEQSEDAILTSNKFDIGLTEINTNSFFKLIRSSGNTHYHNKIGLNPSMNQSEINNLEIRFGQGMQKAHRFTVPVGAGSGVADTNYTYQDYIDVPFQVWDVDNNKQLMISFRDQQDDGSFNLIEYNTAAGDEVNHSREYLFIHNIDYSLTTDSNVVANGGQMFDNLYFLWPYLTSGGVFDPMNLPVSTLAIEVANSTVDAEVNYGTNLTALVPVITVDANSTVSPISGLANDFTEPRIYKVTAQDGITFEKYLVNVTIAAASQESDLIALIALYNSTDGANWTNKWDLSQPLSTWYGVTITDGRVTSLDLNNNQLNGTIPMEIGNLTKLTYLGLWTNQLSGNIPSEIGLLTELTDLDIGDNPLSGTIPTEIWNLTKLKYLGIYYTANTGTIPAEIGNLVNLTWLQLIKTQVSGEIPAEIGNLAKLEKLELWSNQFTGSLPVGLGNLTNLTHLYIYDNQLNGSIPSELINLVSLEDLRLHRNNLTGNIPMELGDLTNLVILTLHENNLTGSIPVEFGNLTQLEGLFLKFNELDGSIPVELGSLTNLSSLSLRGNSFTGSIPASLENTNMTFLYLGDNNLTGPIPPELGNLTNLQDLSLESNNLSGVIPEALGNLSNLNKLILNDNPNLSGSVPQSMTTLNLVELNFQNTDVCEPTNAIYQSWKASVTNYQTSGIDCDALSNEDFELITGISIYPNPVNNILYINGDVSKLKDISIYNLTGQVVMRVKDNFSKINVSRLSSAIYLVKLESEQFFGTYRLIKE